MNAPLRLIKTDTLSPIEQVRRDLASWMNRRKAAGNLTSDIAYITKRILTALRDVEVNGAGESPAHLKHTTDDVAALAAMVSGATQ